MVEVLDIEFSKPHSYARRKAGIEWEYTANLSENLAHGYPCIGGELRKNEQGLWTARFFENTLWQPPAKDRRQAIENAMPATATAVADRERADRERKQREAEERRKAADEREEQERLAKAAPEMLTALKDAASEMLLMGWALQQKERCRIVYQQVRDAIAKAENN